MQATSSSDIKIIMAGFQAMSDPLRMRIIASLQEQELCVCDLCDRLKTSQSKLSFHLKTLKEAGLITPRQSGRWIYYSLNLKQFILLKQHLAKIIDCTNMISRETCN